MMFRSMLVAALAVMVFGCGSSRMMNDAGSGGGTGFGGASGGGTGTGGTGGTGGSGGSTGGSGGSTGGSGGSTGGTGGSSFGWDGGMTVDAVKNARFCQGVRVENVVVTGVDGNPDGGQASFWIADFANQRSGIYVFKHRTRANPVNYVPRVGDLMNMEAAYDRYDSTWDGFGYRRELHEPCDGGAIRFELLDAGAMVGAEMVATGFGNAMNGSTRPNPELLGARVMIPGPLTITNATPTPMTRLLNGMTAGYNGFEVTGGILVNAIVARTDVDGGQCAYRVFLDGGMVTFPNGIMGIWDTYTHAPCAMGTSCGASRDAGYVPGTTNTYTNVLYPMGCADLPYP